MLQPTVPAIVNDLAERPRPRSLQRGVGRCLPGGAITAPVAAGWLLDRRLGGVFIAVLLGCLVLVAALALALEREVTPEVNGVTAA